MPHSGDERSPLRSERGAITSGQVIGLALLVLAGYLLLGFAGGDHGRHGRIQVPGEALLELPGGESKVYFTQSEASADPAVPADLAIRIRRGPGADPVEVDPRAEEPEVRDGESVRLIGSINPPEQGRYEVQVTSNELAGHLSPQVTFGQSSFGAIGERVDSVVDAALGPIGIAVAGLLAAIWFIPRLKLALARRNG